MCIPAALAGPLALAGSAISAAGTVASFAYQGQMARYQAGIAEQNKQVGREAAADGVVQGQEQQRQLGREVAARVGAQEARMGANNIDITSGSAARLIDDTRMIGREDSEALSENISRQVRAMQTDIWSYESERRASKAEAGYAPVAAAFGAASTLLGGATQYADFKRRQSGR